MAEQSIKQNYNNATVGLNMDQGLSQIKPGALTYSLNASLENFDSNSASYQNELGNEFCLSFPEGFVLIGTHFINEKNKHIFYITNPETNESEIGYMDNNDCKYNTLVSSTCLNFNINHPIHKTVHKITNCTIEIYWTDGINPRRYLDINNIPKLLKSGSTLCDPVYTDELDCNQLKLQPNFTIPELSVKEITTGGQLLAGTYQFAVQYSDAVGNPYTSYYSVTNPCPIADIAITTVNYNYNVGKSIVLSITDLDTTGQYQYYNIAVIKTINGVASPELVGTYFIEQPTDQIIYTGQNETQIKLSINDIFEKFPYYELAQDVTSVQDVLVWDNLTSIDRINYQSIASNISLLWETYRIPATENYADEINATNLRGYLRDEVYAFEIVFLLANGKQTDGFHIPGRKKSYVELTSPDVLETDDDFIGQVEPNTNYSPYWKVYNTASVLGTSPEYSTAINYKGPYQYGEFAYWESTEEYPCNEDVWGDLSGQVIRHHKFPDILVSPAFESKFFSGINTMVMGSDAVFPIGVKIDNDQIRTLINNSLLTASQKADIVGYKIVRGDRATNKSIVAKGILRNVGEYEREGQHYYYPNYPYNDLKEDLFLNKTNNAWTDVCEPFNINVTAFDITGICKIEYTSCNTNKLITEELKTLGTHTICAITKPRILSGTATSAYGNYNQYTVSSDFGDIFSLPFPQACQGWEVSWMNEFGVLDHAWLATSPNPNNPGTTKIINVKIGTDPFCSDNCDACNKFISEPTLVTSAKDCKIPDPQPALPETNARRQIFNSPETSFAQPFLGNILKLENVIYGKGKAHFVSVKNNAKYRLLTAEAQRDALKSSIDIGALTGSFNVSAMFTVFQAYLTIYTNGITRKNYAKSYNSIADYSYSEAIPNGLGIKQRNLDIKKYLISGVQAVGDNIAINNYNRESCVYLKTDEDKPVLPFPSNSVNMLINNTPKIEDKSRLTIEYSGFCGKPETEQDIQTVSYYASLKNQFANQWGQIYSYETIDTGFQKNINASGSFTIFGGDTFISRFAFKTKFPFFIDNRVNSPDDADIFFDEIGNVAYPKYWHSARSKLEDYTVAPGGTGILSNIISYKAHNFDCKNSQEPGPTSTPPVAAQDNPNRTYYDGYFYLFAYGIPNFYCESSYNIDLRQAFNNKEGDFFPHVSSGIPDDWLQETNVSILNDNTYTYNVTFSKQNKENSFTHLPADWSDQLCYTHYPFRAIYSDSQNIDSDNRVNSWLTYRALSYHDFPQNYGNLTSLDGIQNKAVLARFENKSLLYNNLLTIDTNNPQAAYVGNPTLFKGAPPIDFAETDLGYVGSQNKFLLKIPEGQITVDAKRGQIFLIQGSQAVDLSAFGSGMNRFLTEHLSFEVLRWFPNINIDNHFTGIGLHGVYDGNFDRVIITKLDFIPINNDVKYDDVSKEFYVEDTINNVSFRTQIYLTDSDYFCNKSWTLSYNINTKSWVSFHSYIPNWYIAENNFFYSGINGCCEDFDLVAGVVVQSPPTTTTTTTQAPITTTTTTTLALDCTLAGMGRFVNCSFTGTAIETLAPCNRPIGTIETILVSGYRVASVNTISTGSQTDACNALNYILNSTSYSYIEVTGKALNLDLYSTVYAANNTEDCTTIPDGWYFTDQSANTTGNVYHIVSGIIIEISTCPTYFCTLYKASKTLTGISTINYIGCDNIPTIIEVGNVTGGYSEVTFCAKCCTTVPANVTLTNIGYC